MAWYVIDLDAAESLEGTAQHDMSQGRRGNAELRLAVAQMYRGEQPNDHEIRQELGRGREEN